MPRGHGQLLDLRLTQIDVEVTVVGHRGGGLFLLAGWVKVINPYIILLALLAVHRFVGSTAGLVSLAGAGEGAVGRTIRCQVTPILPLPSLQRVAASGAGCGTAGPISGAAAAAVFLLGDLGQYRGLATVPLPLLAAAVLRTCSPLTHAPSATTPVLATATPTLVPPRPAIGQHALHMIGTLAAGPALGQVQLQECGRFSRHVGGVDTALLLQNDMVGHVTLKVGHDVEEQPTDHHGDTGEDIGCAGRGVGRFQVACGINQQQTPLNTIVTGGKKRWGGGEAGDSSIFVFTMSHSKKKSPSSPPHPHYTAASGIISGQWRLQWKGSFWAA